MRPLVRQVNGFWAASVSPLSSASDASAPYFGQGYTARLGQPLRVFLSCGETSGDLYGGGLLAELRRAHPDLQAFGLGGDRMEAEGARLLAHSRDLAMVGFFAVLAHLRRLRGILRQAIEEADRIRPDVAVLVDYPDFNLRLARALTRRGIPVVYYVSPQIWAWRRGRIHAIRRDVRRMLTIFPFEEAIYRKAGVPVTFVGHPLVDLVRPAADTGAFLAEKGLDPARPIVTILPGSRKQEIAHNLPTIAAAVHRLAQRRPDLQFLLAAAPGLDPQQLALPFPLLTRTVSGATHSALGVADAAIVASGTATVEAALLGTPMVVVYRVEALSYALGRHLVKVPHVAMANLIAERRLVTELIQGQFTPTAVEREVLSLLDDETRQQGVRTGLAEVRRRLGAPGAPARAAAAVLEEIEAARSRGTKSP